MFRLDIVPVADENYDDNYSSAESKTSFSFTRKEVQSACFLVVLLLFPTMVTAAVHMSFPALVSMSLLHPSLAEQLRQLVLVLPVAIIWLFMSQLLTDYIHGLAYVVNGMPDPVEEIETLDDLPTRATSFYNSRASTKKEDSAVHRRSSSVDFMTLEKETSCLMSTKDYDRRTVCTSMSFIDEEEIEYDSDDDDEYIEEFIGLEEEFDEFEERIEPAQYLFFLAFAVWGQCCWMLLFTFTRT